FAVCDNAVQILLFDSDNILVGLVDKALLQGWSYQVVDTDRDARFRRVQEAEGLEIVKHLDGHLMAQADVRVVNERLQAFLLQRAVDEWQTSRNRIVKDDATDGRINDAADVVLNCRTQDVLRIVFLHEVDQVALDAEFDRRLSC